MKEVGSMRRSTLEKWNEHSFQRMNEGMRIINISLITPNLFRVQISYQPGNPPPLHFIQVNLSKPTPILALLART